MMNRWRWLVIKLHPAAVVIAIRLSGILMLLLMTQFFFSENDARWSLSMLCDFKVINFSCLERKMMTIEETSWFYYHYYQRYSVFPTEPCVLDVHIERDCMKKNLFIQKSYNTGYCFCSCYITTKHVSALSGCTNVYFNVNKKHSMDVFIYNNKLIHAKYWYIDFFPIFSVSLLRANIFLSLVFIL